jgi:hypothetical protein
MARSAAWDKDETKVSSSRRAFFIKVEGLVRSKLWVRFNV